MTQPEEISVYLSSLNRLSKRIPESQYSVPDTDSISDLIDLLKIPCGEKIVVDFENEDGWTWRDEHSGPFSWMTRSQQDLTEIGTGDDVKSPGDQATLRKSTFAADDPGQPTTELSEIQAAFQKFGLNSVDESEMKQETTIAEIERKPAERSPSVSSEPEVFSVPSSVSSQTASPVHQAVSIESFSPVHQPTTANMRKWSSADRKDTEAEESLISQTHAGHSSLAFELERQDDILSIVLEDHSTTDLAGVHRGNSHDSNTGDKAAILETDDATKGGYDNTGGDFISLDLGLTTESSTDIRKTGFDFLDNW